MVQHDTFLLNLWKSNFADDVLAGGIGWSLV